MTEGREETKGGQAGGKHQFEKTHHFEEGKTPSKSIAHPSNVHVTS
jgi:hypothetical protein